MARVLLLALRFWPATGGVEQRIWEVARRLAKQHEVTVLASDLRREQPFDRFAPGAAPAEAEGVRIVRLAAKPVLPLEGYGVRIEGLAPALREGLRNADLLDVHPYGAAHTDLAVRLARRMGKPVALTAHFHPADTAGHPWLRALYDATQGRATLRRAQRVVAVTGQEREVLARLGARPDALRVIPNGLDAAQFRDLGRAREPGLLLGVGRLAPVKGFDVAIEAVARLRGEGREVRLLLQGEDWGEGPRLRALAQRLGVAEHVAFGGPVDQEGLVALYNRAELFLAPSRYEAFGIAALEAVACGCPAVVSDVGGLPEAIGPCGVAVPRKAEAFAATIARLLDDPRARKGFALSGRTHGQAHDWDRIAARVDALWRELAGGRP